MKSRITILTRTVMFATLIAMPSYLHGMQGAPTQHDQHHSDQTSPPTTAIQAPGKPDMGMAKADPMMGKDMNPAGGAAGVAMGKVAAKPSLPIDDSVVKEVWGHLPDKLRQQVSQYYKEQFMPKYSDLLKQYYSSLANAPQKP